MVATEKARIYLTIPDVCESYDCTLEVDNYAEWEVEIKRDVLEATQKTTTFPFAFTGKSKQYLDTTFNNWYQEAEASVVILSTSNSTRYFSVKYDLDFSTYSFDDYRTEVSCRNIDLRTLIKKNGNTDYDIPVSSVALDKVLKYERVTLRNELVMRRAGVDDVYSYWDEKGAAPVVTTFYPPLTYSSADTPIKDVIKYKDSQDTDENNQEATWFVTSGGGGQAYKMSNYNIKYVAESEAAFMSFMGTSYAKGQYDSFFTDPKSQIYLKLKLINGQGGLLAQSVIPMTQLPVMATPHKPSGAPETWVTWGCVCGNIENGKTLLEYNSYGIQSKVSFVATFGDDTRSVEADALPSPVMTFAGFGDVIVSYDAKYLGIKSLSCTNFERLMRACLINMGADENVEVTCSDDFASKIKFVCSDTLQARTEQLFTVSFNALANLLKMIGCTYKIDGNTFEIIPLVGSNGAFQDPANVEIQYEQTEVADLTIEPYTEMLYSEVAFSLDSNSVDGVSANLEFNRTTTYAAPINSTNKLELSTKIRTDSTGFEMAIPEKDGDDNERKKDIWAIFCNEDGAFYLPTQAVVNGEQTDRLNAELNPHYLMSRWRKILCAATDVYRIASTDVDASISTLTIGGKVYNIRENYSVMQDLNAGSGIFSIVKPVAVEVATSDDKGIISDGLLNGTTTFTYKGKFYEGYILETTENPLLQAETNLKIMLRNNDTNFYKHRIIVSSYQNKAFQFENSYDLSVTAFGFWINSRNFRFSTSIPDYVTVSVLSIINNRAYIRVNFAENAFQTGSGSERTATIYATYSSTERFTVAIITQSAWESSAIVQIPSPTELSRNSELSENIFVLKATTDKLSVPNIIYYSSTAVREYGGLSTASMYPCLPAVFYSVSYDDTVNQLLFHVYGKGGDLVDYNPVVYQIGYGSTSNPDWGVQDTVKFQFK